MEPKDRGWCHNRDLLNKGTVHSLGYLYSVGSLLFQYTTNKVFLSVATMEDSYSRIRREEKDADHRLHREIIHLTEALVRTDKDNAIPVDSITDNIKRISDVLQRISYKKLDVKRFFCNPILDLLSVGPLSRTEIPLDVLSQLISLGFDVNSRKSYDETCLDIAVGNKHYNAATLLDRHGAANAFRKPLICLLAGQPNVPLDLFDMLATPHNLNPELWSPLHKATDCGHTSIALHLIKLGASVNHKDTLAKLPIEYYVVNETNRFNNELFVSLLPARDHGVNILTTICEILVNKQQDGNNSYLLEMIRHLIQRLHFDMPMEVEIEYEGEYSGSFTINSVDITPALGISLQVMYLCSLILVELQLDLILGPSKIATEVQHQTTKQDTYYAHAVDEIWGNYCQQTHVKSLKRLCILCVRGSMSSLDDVSFLSLPVPPCIGKLLSYRDVSEKIFEE